MQTGPLDQSVQETSRYTVPQAGEIGPPNRSDQSGPEEPQTQVKSSHLAHQVNTWSFK